MFLGIDIGTSKTAAVVVRADASVAASASRAHEADCAAPEGYAEQDCGLLTRSVIQVVASLPAEARETVRAVGLTGQMHGVLTLDPDGEPLGPFVTWQDGRCREDALLEQLAARTGHRLRTGYGCATLAWWTAHERLPPRASAAATVQDWVAAVLCGRSRPITDPTDAASWGLFDLASMAWDWDAVHAARIPERLLPEIAPCGSRIGAVTPASSIRFGIPAGIPVVVPIGDNQASLLATLREPERELALTLGTGGQLSAVQDATARPTGLHAPSADASWEYRPYPGGRLLAVAACLCGGSAWKWLEETARLWTRDLGGLELSADEVYARLNELGATAGSRGLLVEPHFLGERHDADERASITGIDFTNFSPGSLARATAVGICRTLRDMLPAELRAGRARLVASGNALDKNSLLRAAAEQVFGMPLVGGEVREAAAVGAALQAARSCSAEQG